MKGTWTFEYDTENYDHLREIKLLQQARSMASVLFDIDTWLRNQVKYGPTDFAHIPSATPEEVTVILEKVREEFWKFLNEENIRIEDL